MRSRGIFADTNLLLYALDEREREKQPRAAEWHAYLWQGNSGRISSQVISEFHVNLQRKMGSRMSAEEAWVKASRYLAWKPRAVDEEVLIAAREIERRYKINWWDCQIVAAAQLQGCELLLTEDLQDGMKFGGLTVRSPFTLSVEQPVAPYAAGPMLANLHRPRGRPRRATARL